MREISLYTCDSCGMVSAEPHRLWDEDTGTVLMQCPWCGSEDLTLYHTCRSCGAWLREEIDESCALCFDKDD